jgi:transcriptional regulator with XRE-family HTH domain
MLLGMDDEKLLETLGRRIRDRRGELGWTQEQLADIAHIDRSYIGGVERGERNVTFTMLCKICIALRCDLGVLTHQIFKVKA